MFSSLYEPRVLRRDADWAALYKPPGRETVSQEGKPDLLAQAGSILSSDYLRPVHRLDRDTSGIQLFALNSAAEQEFDRLFRQRLVEKRYLALCLGKPRNRTGMIRRNLSEWSGGRKPVRVVKQGGLKAETGYEVIASGLMDPRQAVKSNAGQNNSFGDAIVSLLAFFPHQGRTHQIRVHAAAFGYPILGDDQYGDRGANRVAAKFGIERQALHCADLGFAWHGKRVNVSCQLPPDMAEAGRIWFGSNNGLE